MAVLLAKRKNTSKKRRRIVSSAAILLLGAFLLGGCGADREQQTRFRDAGVYAMSQGDYKAAEKNFKDAIACSGGRVTDAEQNLTYYLGASYFLEGKYEEAAESYDNLLTYDPKDANAYFLRGSLYLKTGKKKKGLEDYKKAAELSDKDYELVISIYENLESYGMKKQAMEFINKASEIGGDDADSLFYRGRIYQIMGQDDVSKSTLQRAMDGGNDQAAIYLARAYMKEGAKKKALKIAKQYYKIEEKDDDLSVLAGQLLLTVGKYKKANDVYKKALGAEQESGVESLRHKDLLKGRIASLEHCGSFEEALPLAREYIKRYPADQKMMRELSFLEQIGGGNGQSH